MIPQTLVINSSNPELDYLAKSLSEADRLSVYIRRYANKQRWHERTLAQIPGCGRVWKNTFGRRVLPTGLDPNRVVCAGQLSDFATALTDRGILANWGRAGSPAFVARVDAAIRQRAARLVSTLGAEAIVANYGLALDAFRHVSETATIAILNYPIAHHRYTNALLADEAEREPEVASTLQQKFASSEREERIDAEIELASAVFVGSSFVKDSFVVSGVASSKIVTIPYGVDVGTFRPPEGKRTDGKFRAFFAGQLGQRKGLLYLLRAFKAFQRPGTELRVAGRVVGDSNAFAQYAHLYEYLGHLTRPALAAAFQEADVFVFPTLLEGMPLTLLEAMAAGLPVITTTHGPADIVRDGIDGFLIPIRDEQAIIEKLTYLHEHPDERRQMGRNARERALSFTWEAYGAKALLALEELAFANSRSLATA